VTTVEYGMSVAISGRWVVAKIGVRGVAKKVGDKCGKAWGWMWLKIKDKCSHVWEVSVAKCGRPVWQSVGVSVEDECGGQVWGVSVAEHGEKYGLCGG
jgi:hypothetical protein